MSRRVNPLTSLRGFIEKVESLAVAADEHLFFRGHSNRDSYYIEPSVYRKPQGKEAEHVLYRELITTNPNEFKEDDSTLERLARMQHHSTPTRLLDITSNPLVALYFACSNDEGIHGEVIVFKVKQSAVKFFDSDTASCIANLARMSKEDKEGLDLELPRIQFNSSDLANRLLHFIKDEKPYFSNNIDPADLKRVLVVRPKLSSKRILAQAGAFLLFGQIGRIDDNPIPDVDVARIIIDKDSKGKISQSLESLNINEGSLYLDIDSYSKHLKKKHGL